MERNPQLLQIACDISGGGGPGRLRVVTIAPNGHPNDEPHQTVALAGARVPFREQSGRFIDRPERGFCPVLVRARFGAHLWNVEVSRRLFFFPLLLLPFRVVKGVYVVDYRQAKFFSVGVTRFFVFVMTEPVFRVRPLRWKRVLAKRKE
jgi:hypothetical protein